MLRQGGDWGPSLSPTCLGVGGQLAAGQSFLSFLLQMLEGEGATRELLRLAHVWISSGNHGVPTSIRSLSHMGTSSSSPDAGVSTHYTSHVLISHLSRLSFYVPFPMKTPGLWAWVTVTAELMKELCLPLSQYSGMSAGPLRRKNTGVSDFQGSSNSHDS